MKKILPGLVAGALLVMLWPAAALAAPVTVNLRVEGAAATAFEGPVTTDTTTGRRQRQRRPHLRRDERRPAGGAPAPTGGRRVADSGVAFSAS